MAVRDETEQTTRMSDAAVQAKTGKNWAEWFELLDAAGAETMSHQQIVAYLREQHQLSGWWQQNVTVTYEQARGLRAKHQMPDGFQISVTKTLPASASRVFAAWQDAELRARWLPDPVVTIRTMTPDKSVRLVWVDGSSRVDVLLYPKGDHKTQVTVQHHKLPHAAAAAQMKVYWAEAVAQLKQLLIT